MSMIFHLIIKALMFMILDIHIFMILDILLDIQKYLKGKYYIKQSLD